MKKNSKKPEIRRQELIDVALRLFVERGYESVSVRDILDAVGGAPGMFYYYFKSKQDIYIAAMDQFLTERLARKCALLEDCTLPFDEKASAFRALVTKDIREYIAQFHPSAGDSVTDSSYKLWTLVQMINRLVKPYAAFILEGIREGRLPNSLGITKENAEQYALFTLYGAWGTIYNGQFAEGAQAFDTPEALGIIQKIYHPNRQA